MKRIFLDMDGVIADWEKSAAAYLGHIDYSKISWQELIGVAPDLYANLEVMDGAYELIQFIRSSSQVESVKILTAIPSRVSWPQCTDHKREWVKKYFGDIEVLFGPYAKDKQYHCKGINDILIDDSELNIPQWRSRGGIGILHTSTEDTIEVLKHFI